MQTLTYITEEEYFDLLAESDVRLEFASKTKSRSVQTYPKTTFMGKE
jgi:hypothetical protein